MREKTIRVPMRDGCQLAADLFLPDREAACPAILLRTPYGRENVKQDWLYSHPQRLTEEGYAVLFQDCRGTGDSDGLLKLNGENEHEDGYDTVEWMAQQPWCNGRVGMFGLSYFGFTQLAAASMRPPHLRAVCPFMTVSMEPFGASQMRTTNVFHLVWALSQVIRQPEKHIKDPALRESLLPVLVQSRDRLAQDALYLPMDAHPAALAEIPLLSDYLRLQRGVEDSAFWRTLRCPMDYDHADAAMFFATGWQDVACQSTLDGYRAARRSANAYVRENARLLIGPWNHGGMLPSVIEDQDYGADSSGAAQDVEGMMLRFFDRHLKERQTQPFEGRVRYFITGSNTWREAEDWPPRTDVLELYPAADGALGMRAAPATASYTYRPDHPAPSEYTDGEGRTEAADWRCVSQRPDVLCYRGSPQKVGLTVAGEVVLMLRAITDAADTDFVCRLLDEDETGRQYALTAGLVRARYRHGLFRDDPIRPGEMVEYRLSVGHTAHTFLPGHRVCVQITSSMFPKHNRNLNTGLSNTTTTGFVCAKQQILLGGKDGTRLLLPVEQ